MATGRLGNIVFYAENPQALSDFWAGALGYPTARIEGDFRDQLLDGGLTEEDLTKRGLAEDPDGVGPRLLFHHADGPKESRNRVHLDLQAVPEGIPTEEQLHEEKDRLVALGATVVRVVDQQWGPFRESYIQMLDPEGNEFCLQ